MPISHPPFYATYLAKRIGKFATLGLAEDTWALNEGVISDEIFCSSRTTSTASAKRCSSRRWTGFATGHAGLACSMRPTGSSTCSGARLRDVRTGRRR